jgi:outer membrane receptor for ferrienterochelin and colicins
MKSPGIASVLIVLCLWSAPAAAQTTTPDILSIQELLDAEIVSTASKFPQPLMRAPASVTVITADEIRRLGHRTLADILRGARGLYVNDDRNYSYTGVRGFARPGDYNTRVLLLVDGHRLNDPIYDMAPVGTDLPIDVESIDRVEIVRGPGSSLYGTNAILAVVNLITKQGRDAEGTRVSATRGTLGTLGGRVSTARIFRNGADLFLSGSLQEHDGPASIYFPEFDDAATGFGVVRNGDRDKFGRLFGGLSMGRLSIHGAYSDRRKQVPTASFGTVFGDSRFQTDDSRSYLDATYSGAFAAGWSGLARAGFDRYNYTGTYPFDYGTGGIEVFDDGAKADWLSGELTAHRRVAGRHMVTLGGETRYSLRQRQYARELSLEKVYDDRRSSTAGAYLHDDLTLTSSLALNGGARVDLHDELGAEVSPRAGLVFTPGTSTSLKAMYGRAFRAPNAYERYYFAVPLDVSIPELRPERVSTAEGAWEQRLGRYVRSTVSLFRSDIRDLISQSSNDEGTLYFANLSNAKSWGAEAEIEVRSGRDFVARGSYAWTRTVDDVTGEPLSNSPAHVSKLDVIVPLGRSGLFFGSNAAFMDARRTIHGTTVPGFFVQNATLTADGLWKGLDLQVGIYNLFDARYGDPAAEEHVQEQIPQDGRSLRATFSVHF